MFVDAPQVRAVFAPSNAAFLQQEGGYDPAQLAGQLPASLPVLVLHGDLDTKVDEQDIQHLLSGFQAVGNTSVQLSEFAGVDHELRQLPPGQAPSLNVSYPFSPAVIDAVASFAQAVVHRLQPLREATTSSCGA